MWDKLLSGNYTTSFAIEGLIVALVVVLWFLGRRKKAKKQWRGGKWQ